MGYTAFINAKLLRGSCKQGAEICILPPPATPIRLRTFHLAAYAPCRHVWRTHVLAYVRFSIRRLDARPPEATNNCDRSDVQTLETVSGRTVGSPKENVFSSDSNRVRARYGRQADDRKTGSNFFVAAADFAAGNSRANLGSRPS